jgi:signal transduction histidine kinase
MDGDLRQLWQLNKYIWMCLAFVLFYLPVAQAQGSITSPAWVAWLVFGLGLADGAARTYWAYRRGGTLPLGWAWFFTYLDLLIISLAVGITGGIQSDLWLLYFVVMIYESLYAAPLTKRLMNASVCAAYLLATLPDQVSLASSLPPAVYARILATRLFFVVIVSALARRISANALARHRELTLLREQMAVAEERARIVQEALTNAAKHAQCSAIEVRLTRSSGSLVCTVRDDGRGFARESAPAGVGLLTMRERAEALGGTLRVESAPGSGTTITVSLPA